MRKKKQLLHRAAHLLTQVIPKSIAPTFAKPKKGSKYPNNQDLMKFSKTDIPFTLVGYEIGYSLPHIQHALTNRD